MCHKSIHIHLLVVTLLGVGTLLPQDATSQVEVGVTMGGSFSHQDISNPEDASIRYYNSRERVSQSTRIFGGSIGLSLRKWINQRLLTSGQLQYTQKGQIEEITHDGTLNDPPYVAATYKDRLNYLVIPGKVGYSLLPSMTFDLIVSGGAYVGVGLGGTTRLEEFEPGTAFIAPTISEGEVYFSQTLSSRDDYEVYDLVVRPLDFGLVGGLELSNQWFGFFMDYQYGLYDVHAKIDNVRPASNDDEHNARKKLNRSMVIGVNIWLSNFKR